MPLLVSHAMFVQSHTVPSAVRSFIRKQSVKFEHRSAYTARQTHSGIIAHRYRDRGSSSSFVRCLHTAIYHTKHNDCRLVINELLNLSEPPGAITERARV